MCSVSLALTQWAVDKLLDEGEEEKEKRKEAREALNEILDRQYPLFKTISLAEAMEIAGIKGSAADDYIWAQNIVGTLADWRLSGALDTVEAYRDTIRAVAEEFHLPPEMIGSVILKELYTQSIPDGIANITSTAGVAIPFLAQEAPKIFGEHSTGPGAIFPNTARPVWESYLGKEEADALLPATDLELQYKLANDPAFNIRTIGAILSHVAREGGYDLSKSGGRLSSAALQDILSMYNAGSKKKTNGIPYAKRTAEYFPYIKILLGL